MGATFVGMPPFPQAAHLALADPQLRANLAHATTTIRDKRGRVVGELDDWEALRVKAAGIKDDVLAHLDEHLETLEASLTARGAVVHWARDAAEACAIVAQVAKDHGVDEVVKVKSMATQEIELNEALAAEGISAWETDLAELIVQLGDDLPSHILVPAIHRNRAEIREIFRTRMAGAGRPAPEGLTDEPAELAAAARQHLREKFLRAKVAVSGANFAVAETGTLVVVESEGNGRMCLTLPEVLVSVVGIEKLVPRFEDLDVFLQLLPRSSTGERMNPYTSMWSGVTPGRRAAGGARRPPRQRAHQRPRRRGRPPGAALHPLLGLPQRLPGLRAHRRPRLRLGLSRPDRRHPHPADEGGRPRRAGRLAAVCVVALRPLLRGVPGADRHPHGARPPAGQGRRRPPRRAAQGRRTSRCKGAALLLVQRRADGVCGQGRLRGQPGRHGPEPAHPAGGAGGHRTPTGAGRGSAWTGARDLPAPPRESFRSWWAKTDGGRNEPPERASGS